MVARFIARKVGKKLMKKSITTTTRSFSKKPMTIAQKNALRKAVKASAMARKKQGFTKLSKNSITRKQFSRIEKDATRMLKSGKKAKIRSTIKNSPTRLKVAAGVGATGYAANKQAKRKSNSSPVIAKYARTTATLGQSTKASLVTTGSLIKNSALTIAGQQSTARGFANVASTAAKEQAKVAAAYAKGTKNVIRANKNKKKK